MGDGTKIGTSSNGGNGTGEPRVTVRRRTSHALKKSLDLARTINRAAALKVGQTDRGIAVREHGVGPLSYTVRRLDGGKDQFMELARLSEAGPIKALVKEWDDYSPSRRHNTSLDILCSRMGVAPADVLADVVKSAFLVNRDISKLLQSVSEPRIVAKSIKMALLSKGFKDRELMLQATGIAPKGGGIHVSAQASAEAKAAAAAKTSGLPSFESEMQTTAEAVRSD